MIQVIEIHQTIAPAEPHFFIDEHDMCQGVLSFWLIATIQDEDGDTYKNVFPILGNGVDSLEQQIEHLSCHPWNVYHWSEMKRYIEDFDVKCEYTVLVFLKKLWGENQ